MPVVVTTAVQFFESLFAGRSSQCRKLHNLAKSVIIFDEAQMMPVPYLRPCVFAIAQLVKNYGVSAVLCTATQPALDGIFREFLPDRPTVELCPGFHQETFRRVTFRREGRLSWEAAAEQISGQKQALCVVNSRKSAQTVYDLLDKEEAFHLSTLMYPAHRKAALEEIRTRLRDGLPCRVVSTSLIEAGVDVDFPAVFRALGQYGVSVYPQHFAALDLAGDLEVLEDGSAVLVNLALYDSSTGLSLAADSGKALFI